MLILNMHIPAGVVIAIVALFVFLCGFVAGYCFGSLKRPAARDDKVRRERMA